MGPMALDTITDVFSSFFNIPANYFTFPNIIFYFIIPFIAATYFWYVVLRHKLRLFRNSSAVNGILAFFIAFFNVTLLSMIPPFFSVPVFIGFAILLSGSFSWKRIILCIAIGVFLGLFYPWIMSMFL